MGIEKADGSIEWTEVSAVSSSIPDWNVVIATVDISKRRQAEKDLKENLMALQSIIDTSPLAIITTDTHGITTLWNKAAESIFGWTEQEVLGKPLPIYPDEGPENLDVIVNRILNSSGHLHYEGIRKRKDGTLINVSVAAVALRDYNNKPNGILGVLADITELKKIEADNQKMAEERNQLLKRLRLQFNRMPVGFILTDADLNILDWNPQAEKIFGYSREEIIGKNQYDTIIPPEKRELVKDIVEKTIHGSHTEVMVHENLNKDGRRITVEWHNTSLWDESGKLIALMAMAIDVTEKIEAEKKLRASEEKLRAFFDANLIGISIGDIYGNIFSANDELLRIIGYSRAELDAGLIHWDKITPKEFLPLDEAAIKQAQQSDVCTPYEKQYLRKNGKTVWVLVGFVLIGLKRENSVGFIMDISKRKQAAQSLVDSEARYRGLFTNMTNGIAYCKMLHENGQPQDFIYISVNEAFERLTGLKDVEGKKVSSVIPGIQNDNPELFEIYGRVAANGKPEHFETYLPALGIWFSISVYCPEKGFFVAVFENTTEQKQAQKLIEDKQDLLNLTGMIGKIGGWEFDAHSLKGTWTEEVARIHDLDLALETNVELGISFYHGESRQKIEAAIKEAVELGKSYDLELELVSAKGIPKLVRAVGQPEFVGDEVVKVRGIFQDITELKKAEAEIKKLNEELEQRVKDRTAELQAANKELEAFSYSVSHDLRAPIRAIGGFSQIIMDDYVDVVNPEVLHYLEIIRKNSQNMGQLVDDLLAFSRLGQQAIQKKKVDVKALVNEVLDEMQADLSGRQIKFRVDKLPACRADPRLLKQVYINLISNAIKFTRTCNNALIEVGSCVASPPVVDGQERPERLCYFVRDNGVGFDMRYYGKIFGVFQRLHKPEEYEGTGVGLAIVRRVIEKHGGQIWAESKPNSGATFYFFLREEQNDNKPG